MSYWSEVKDVAMKGVDLAIANFKETADHAIEKGKDGVSYVQLKKDLFVAQRELHNLLGDLGDLVVDIYKANGDIYADEKVKECVGKVTAAEGKCKDIESKMNDISKKS
ncbi:MAG TPA: hypothetical protein PK358_04230 [Spirochaetota bacterium]|nr:hypothetical protein [Spirochaetota bacterium]HPJ34017.1 hypothetical protein [Spirochaetota bacterium]